MKVLSLFDGMSCGMLAMMAAGIDVEAYDAYEIDKYAVTASKHNFPQIEQHGDVFEADFTAYRGYDFLIGGSPCTYWSIAQRPDKRETVASGLGWELFSQYVRALHEAQPRMFVYENNKSMSKDIRASITETFGFEPICINSALVSAQNRQRLYWVGVRQDDGTYRKASIEQPADRGILLKDVLDSAVPWRDKAHAETATQYKGASLDHHMRKGQRNLVAEPMRVPEATTQGYVDIQPGECVDLTFPSSKTRRGCRMDEKSNCVTAQNNEFYEYMGAAEPVCVVSRGRNPENPSDRTAGAPTEQRFEAHEDGKTNTLTSVSKDNLIADPIRIGTMPRESDGQQTQGQAFRIYSPDGKGATIKANAGGGGGKTGLYAVSTDATDLSSYGFIAGQTSGTSAVEFLGGFSKDGEMRLNDGKTYSRNFRQGQRLYGTDAKSATLTAQGANIGGHTGPYATQEQQKEQRVYTVQDGMIDVNGKRYPIKLRDGRYIIRKLTVTECMRLQTVPEWYDFSCVSNTQAYKMLGNGWTVEVIAHLIRGAIRSSILGI